jgi:GNAT superfamily N-acetyltransferase
MELTIRAARTADREAIAAFATNTFSWGDYVPEALDRWIADAAGAVLVAVDDADTPVAVARAGMLSPTEAWLQGARVHPDHRRRGIASRLGEALLDWARRRGALVARLAIEDWNEPARAQVEAVGMRRVAGFARASRRVDAAGLRLDGNGGRRARAGVRFRPAPAAEAEAALVSWSSSPLSREVRGLFAVRWTWRRLSLDDLRAAAAGDALWTAAGGWAIAAVDEEALEVGWCDTTAEGAPDFARALVDLADDRGATEVHAMVPDVAWLTAAFERAGYEVDRIGVYALGL